jgi:hypothetical protein
LTEQNTQHSSPNSQSVWPKSGQGLFQEPLHFFGKFTVDRRRMQSNIAEAGSFCLGPKKNWR